MLPDAEISQVGKAMWRLYACHSVTSTSDLARNLPPWNAVRAHTQTAGRGRFGRVFVSDEGGLWISAVLPAGGNPATWSGFSLMAGSRLQKMLAALGVADIRLRWPNDLMAREKKLAGILIEQGTRDTLTIGLGMNVHNTPWQQNPELAGITTRLADLIPNPPHLDELSTLVLDALADAHEAMQQGGLAAAAAEFNAALVPRPVEIRQTNGPVITGRFTSLDQDGNLRITTKDGTAKTIPHITVERLIEKT